MERNVGFAAGYFQRHRRLNYNFLFGAYPAKGQNWRGQAVHDFDSDGIPTVHSHP